MNPKDLSKIIAAHTAELRSQGFEAAATDLERLVEARDGILVDEAFGGIEMVDTELPKDADGNDIPPMDRVHADHRSEAAIRAQLHLDKLKGLPERMDPLLLDVLTGRRHGDVRVAVDRASQNRGKPELGKLYTREELARDFPARIGYGIRPGAVPLVNNTEPVETDPQTFGGIGVKAIQGLIDAEADRVIARSLQAAKDSKDVFVSANPEFASQFYDANRLTPEAQERAGAERFIAAMKGGVPPLAQFYDATNQTVDSNYGAGMDTLSQQERHQRWMDQHKAMQNIVADPELTNRGKEYVARMSARFQEQLFYPGPAETLLERFARKLKTLFTTRKES